MLGSVEVMYCFMRVQRRVYSSHAQSACTPGTRVVGPGISSSRKVPIAAVKITLQK